MEIIELTAYSALDVQDMDRLMHQLSATSYCNEEKLQRVMDDANSHLYVVRSGSDRSECSEGRMVACATLCVCHTPEMVIGFVEAVVVTAACRGQHLGRKLMERLLTDAKGFGVQSLHLTSNPKRVAANGLYQALGFERYDTNWYKLNL